MKITVIGNTNGIYIDSTNNNAYVDYTTTENYKSVNMTGVEHIVIRRNDDGKMKIIQANGYTPYLGLFNKLY